METLDPSCVLVCTDQRLLMLKSSEIFATSKVYFFILLLQGNYNFFFIITISYIITALTKGCWCWRLARYPLPLRWEREGNTLPVCWCALTKGCWCWRRARFSLPRRYFFSHNDREIFFSPLCVLVCSDQRLLMLKTSEIFATSKVRERIPWSPSVGDKYQE